MYCVGGGIIPPPGENAKHLNFEADNAECLDNFFNKIRSNRYTNPFQFGSRKSNKKGWSVEILTDHLLFHGDSLLLAPKKHVT